MRRSWRVEPRGPNVELLDARDSDLDGAGLRARAAELSFGSAHCSRSYCYPFAVVAVHSQPVGIDLERVEPCSREFACSICTPAELLAPPVGDLEVISLWCGKEALSKALGDPIRYDPRRLESPGAWPGGRAGRWCARRLEIVRHHVTWICWQPA